MLQLTVHEILGRRFTPIHVKLASCLNNQILSASHVNAEASDSHPPKKEIKKAT